MRAVDAEGKVLEVLVQAKRDQHAARTHRIFRAEALVAERKAAGLPA